MQVINEATVRELKSLVDPVRKEKGKHIPAYFRRIVKDGTIEFITPSQTRRGILYTQRIKLLDVKDIKKLNDMKPTDIIRLLLAGDVAVYCSCPDFKYRGYKYMAHQLGYGIKKEDRFPLRNNPGLDGSVCKHVFSVFRVFGMNYRTIYKEMMKSPYYKGKLY